MSKKSIKWARHIWTVKDFSEAVQGTLRGLGQGRPVVVEQINGDRMYVRRINSYAFQCGLDMRPSESADESALCRTNSQKRGPAQNYSEGDWPPL